MSPVARKAKRADWGTSALSLARQRGNLADAIRGALVAAGGSVTRAARMLGVQRTHLYAVCKDEGLDLQAMALAAREAAASPQPT